MYGLVDTDEGYLWGILSIIKHVIGRTSYGSGRCRVQQVCPTLTLCCFTMS